AQGQFITGLDDDDYFLPTRIADFVAHWGQRRAGSVALTSARRKILPDGSEIDLPGKDTVGVKDMYLRNLAGSQAFLETATARQLGGFDPQLKAWQDYDFLFRLAQLGTIENLPVASYVVDASHPHERISTRSYQKVAAACEYFIGKHGISGRQALQVRSQLLVYRFSYPEAVAFLLRFLARGDIAGVKAVIRRFQRSRSSS
ncbi:MAG: hypothetical protein R3228_15470, partial [Halioglobus sp.]|nr:hypothetical protein [Halioglobus sp.]